MEHFTINNASFEEMSFILNLAKNEGWNPGIDDAASFYAADPEGFFIGKLDNQPIGCISAVSYGNAFGFVGLYIILPEHRGKGYGMKLTQHALKRMGDRCLGLDGVVAQQENYKRIGFSYYYRNIRFKGSAKANKDHDLVDAKLLDIRDILNYDAPIFGVARPLFLEKWIQMEHSYALAKVTRGKIEGYGVIRKCDDGYKIGPLFADHFDVAKEIYFGLCDKVPEATIFYDAVEKNQDSLKLAAMEKMEEVFETARMYNRPPPHSELHKIFGVTTFELG